jgi:hypothetical protein
MYKCSAHNFCGKRPIKKCAATLQICNQTKFQDNVVVQRPNTYAIDGFTFDQRRLLGLAPYKIMFFEILEFITYIKNRKQVF